MQEKDSLTEMVAEIVSAYVAKNTVEADALPEIIRNVYSALSDINVSGAPSVTKPAPAVSIKRSVSADYIVCLEDGKKFKSLKRHLQSQYGMTPEDYRAKWGLPSDYPMVAPNYAKARSELARKMGLGRKSKKRKRG